MLLPIEGQKSAEKKAAKPERSKGTQKSRIARAARRSLFNPIMPHTGEVGACAWGLALAAHEFTGRSPAQIGRAKNGVFVRWMPGRRAAPEPLLRMPRLPYLRSDRDA